MGRPGTDPGLVERLFSALREHGYAELALVESRTRRDSERTVATAAREAGYSGAATASSTSSAEPVPFDYGSVLGARRRRADMARRRLPHLVRQGQAAVAVPLRRRLANLYGCLPEPDKLARYHGTGHEFHECCVLIADRLPVDFGLVDAWVAGDGRGVTPTPRRARERARCSRPRTCSRSTGSSGRRWGSTPA